MDCLSGQLAPPKPRSLIARFRFKPRSPNLPPSPQRAPRMNATMTWARVLPGLTQLRSYERGWLRVDLVAGLAVAAYLVPQVMAYATVAGLAPVVGLWSAIVPLAAYAVLGSSRQLSVGPESSTALITAAVLAPIAAGDPRRYAAAAVAVLVGAMCVLAGLGRLGGFWPSCCRGR